MRPTAMLQQNNNNNYPCLEMAGSPGPAFQQCPKTSLPFSGGRLELRDLPLVRGLRAWALCSKNLRRAPATSSGTPGPCPRSADLYPAAEWGRLGYGMGLSPLDSRQAGLGALVTVATLKASEGGGQTQTRCLVLRTEGGRCLYSTAGPGPCSLGGPPQGSPSTLVGSWLRERVGGGIPTGRTGAGARGGSSGTGRAKPRPGRRWRTSCRPTVPPQERAFKNRAEQEAGTRAAEGGQEARDKGSPPSAEWDGQKARQERGSFMSPKSCHTTKAQSYSHCPRRRGGQGAREGGGVGQGGNAGAPDRQSNTVEEAKWEEEEEEETDNGTGPVGLSLRESSLPPASADPEPGSPAAGDRGEEERPDPQGDPPPWTSLHADQQEDRSRDGHAGAGQTDATPVGVTVRPVRDAVGSEGGARGLADHADDRKPSESDPERPGRGEGRGEGGSADGPITVGTPEGSCRLPTSSADTTPPSSPAGGSTATAEAETCCEQAEMKNSLDVVNNNEEEPCERHLPRGRDPGTAVKLDVDAVSKETQSTPPPPEVRDPCRGPRETLCGVSVSDDEPRQVDGHGHVTDQGMEAGPGQEREKTEGRGSEETQEELEKGYRSEDHMTEALKEEISEDDMKEADSEGEHWTEGKERGDFAKVYESQEEEDWTEENRTDELDQERRPQEERRRRGGELGAEVAKEESRPERLEGEYSNEKLKVGMKKECRPEGPCTSAPPAALTEETACGGGGGGEGGGGGSEGEKDSGHSCSSPYLGLAAMSAAPATPVARSCSNPTPLAAMATGLPDPKGVREAGGGASAEIQSLGKQEQGELGSKVASLGGSAEEGQEEVEEEEEDNDVFGLFMQAGEQPSWEDSFASTNPVPCENRESVALENHLISDESAHWTSGWTDSLFHQPEETWTAFPKDAVEDGWDVAGQWWPSCAEETRDRRPAKQDLNTVFMEAFQCLVPPSPVEAEVVPTLKQILRGAPDQRNPAEDHGLLDGFHDLNKMIGWRYKRANAVSCERLLQSLHVDRSDSDNISRPRTTNHSPSLGLNSSNQHAAGKRRLSYDLNKNIME